MKAIFELNNKVRLIVTPVTAFTQKAIIARAEKLYPLPDKKLYELPMPEDEQLTRGQCYPAETNPLWTTDRMTIMQRRGFAALGMLLDTAVTVEQGREAIIQEYAETLTHLKEYMSGSVEEAGMVNDFVTLLTGVLIQEGEIGALMALVQSATPLTSGELSDGFSYFRPVELQRPNVAKILGQSQPPDIQKRKQSASG